MSRCWDRRAASLPPRVPMLEGRAATQPEKRAHPFYLSGGWRSLLARVLATCGRSCEDQAGPPPHGPWSRICGDHIVELRNGGAPLDPANVLLCCADCEARKTARARAARTGIGA